MRKSTGLLVVLALVAASFPALLFGQQSDEPKTKQAPAGARAEKPNDDGAQRDAGADTTFDTLVRPTARPTEYGEESPSAARARKALKTPVTVQFDDVTMREAIDKLAKNGEMTVQYDTKALGDEGVDLDAETVSCQFRDVTLAAAFDNMFAKRSLTWALRHETLWITTGEGLKAMEETRIYDVTDLVARATKTGPVQVNFEPLTEAIEVGVPGPWEAVDGDGGTIVPLESQGIYVLVILNNPRCHDRVEAFLTALRSMRHRAADLQTLQKKSRPLDLKKVPGLEKTVAAMSPVPAEELKLTDDVVQSGNRFAAKLYGELASRSKGNLFVSPYSISTALAMTAGGADGQTREQFREALEFTQPDDEIHAHLRILQRHLLPGLRPANYKLRVANRLWADQKLEILEPFRQLTRDSYKAEIELVDFPNGPATAASINDWVKQQTNGLIPTMVSTEDLNPYMLLALTNAVYFEATWQHSFPETATKPADFDTGAEKVQVPTMHQLAHFRYAEHDKSQILELNYQDAELSMLVLLPPNGSDGLAAMQRLLAPDEMKKWSAELDDAKVNVQFPKFRYRSRFELNDVMKALGIVDAFDIDRADFSGIDGHKRPEPGAIFLHKALHEAFVDVDERGTKAAAGTFAGGGFGGGPPNEPEPVDFIADHPFLFLIRENETGCILFVGRVVNPKET